MIDLYSKNGHVDRAKLAFERLFLRDSISWVAMISGFSQNGREDEAILLFCQMHKSAVVPTPYVFSSVLSACTKIESFKLGEQLHGFIVKWDYLMKLLFAMRLLPRMKISDISVDISSIYLISVMFNMISTMTDISWKYQVCGTRAR